MIQYFLGFWDRLGIGVSGLCAIHCLLTPVFVSLIPIWPTMEIFHDYSHFAFFLVIAPVVYFSLKKKHENKYVIYFMISGLAIIVLAWVYRDSLGEYGESLVTLVGSILLIRGHWLNYKSKKVTTYEAT